MTRRRVLITGAAGGMGRACARLFGMTHDLVLTDVADDPLRRLSHELEQDGFAIAAAEAGEIGDEALLARLAGKLAEGKGPFTLVHTAGVSPTQAEWRTVVQINLVATARLLDAIEPHLTAGSVAVLFASAAGHLMPASSDIAALLDDPHAPDLLDRIAPIVAGRSAEGGGGGPSGVGYALAKQAVIRLAARRAVAWGRSGARIVTISPGLVLTAMGRKELAESPGAAETFGQAPAGRAGTAMDIAQAAHFLASDAATFITGTDLVVDGGWLAALGRC